MEEDASLDLVQLDGLVVLKVIKHCHENLPDIATGLLLGLDNEATLEVTNCFPFPSRFSEDAEEEVDDGAKEYQLEMIRCLRDVNVDHNTVGWYSATYMGSFWGDWRERTNVAIETQFNYQERIPKSVVIVYDPLKTTQGSLSLNAYRLSKGFMELYRNNNLSKQSVIKENVSFHNIFEEIPIKLHNSSLVQAYLMELQGAGKLQYDFDRLNLSTNPFLEKNMEFQTECLDVLTAEQNKFQHYQRNVQRQQAQQQAWLQKRRAENEARKRSGEELLPEEDSTNPIFKPVPEPSRFESLWLTNQINNYCEQINQFSRNSLAKLYLVGAVQKD